MKPAGAPDREAARAATGLEALEDDALRVILDELERRRPGAPVPSVGVRPKRRPWTYRDIWRLEAVRAELRRRGLVDSGG